MSKVFLMSISIVASTCLAKEATRREPADAPKDSGKVERASRAGGVTCGSGFKDPTTLTPAMGVCDPRRPFQVFYRPEQYDFCCVEDVRLK